MNIEISGILGDKENIYLLGSAIVVEASFEEAPDSVTISVRTPSGTKVVDNVAMTASLTTFFSYTYQTAIGGVEGTYVVTVKFVKGAYTGYKEEKVSFVRQFMQ